MASATQNERLAAAVEREAIEASPVGQSPLAELLSRNARIYDRVADPISFAEKAADSYASLVGAPVAHGFAIAMTCLCEGITAHEYARRYHCINGRPVPKADWMLAKIRSLGGDHDEIERTAEAAEINITWKGKTVTTRFTWDDAQESRWPWRDWRDHDKGLKDNWSTRTDRKSMLWHRATSDLINAAFPEVHVGGDTMDEALDAEMIASPDAAGRQAAKRTAVEAIAANQEREQREAVAVDGLEGDATKRQEKESPPFDPQPVAEQQPSGTISKVQRSRICELYDELAVPVAEQQKALEKRGVNHVGGLSAEQADELLTKLQALRARRGN